MSQIIQKTWLSRRFPHSENYKLKSMFIYNNFQTWLLTGWQYSQSETMLKILDNWYGSLHEIFFIIKTGHERLVCRHLPCLCSWRWKNPEDNKSIITGRPWDCQQGKLKCIQWIPSCHCVNLCVWNWMMHISWTWLYVHTQGNTYMSIVDGYLIRVGDLEYISDISVRLAQVIFNYTLRTLFQWNFIQNSKVFIHENAFETVVWKIAAILSRPQSVLWSDYIYDWDLMTWCPSSIFIVS